MNDASAALPTRRGFICAGCWTVDRIKLIDQWPAEEELARIVGVDKQGGGSAHNVGINLRKLDDTIPVATIGMTGHDEDGDYLRQRALVHGVETTQLQRSEQLSTSYTDVMSVTGTGRRTFFHYPGANDLLTPAHFDFSGSHARILHLGLLSLHALMDAPVQGDSNGWAEVLKQAQSCGMLTSIEMVSIDAHRNRELAIPCLAHLSYLIVNDHEIGSIAGIQTIREGKTMVDQCLQAARKVLSMGCMDLVVVHYPDGAVCLTRDGQHLETASLSVPRDLIVGSVGAGDAFAAGLLYALHEQWSLNDALSLAHAVAATSLRSATTVGAVESVERCLQLAAGWRCQNTGGE